MLIQGTRPEDPEELKRRVERFNTKIEQTLVAYSPRRNRTATQTAKTAAARKYVTLILALNPDPNRPLKSKDVDTTDSAALTQTLT